MNCVEIVRMDHHGRGIGYIDGKIIFVPNTLVGEEVNVLIVAEKKNYLEGKVVEFLKKSSARCSSKCPYFLECGGCNLLHMKYEDTIKYKLDKIKSILKLAKIEFDDINVIKNEKTYNYRNKIELKIIDGKCGYFKNDTHTLVEIDACLVANPAINKFIRDINYLNLKNALVTIRCNYNEELLIVIETQDDMLIDTKYLASNHKLVGIVFNKKVMYGSPHFIDIINHKLFRVSYDAFFQINPKVTSKMFDLLQDNISESNVVLDLYAGVGTLGIVASEKAHKVYSVEIVENAIKDGLVNAKMNKIDNIYFMLGDVSKVIDKIKDEVDLIIVDPPRKGLDKKTIQFLKNTKANTIIYISCDPMTLVRDLKDLTSDYEIKKFNIMDMFSYTYHIESMVVLKRKA
ncbi:MAG: class I SAM-dependent RNA methyltransferase [Bacilli bacterium]|nr:class I SAM-dependent RNA methyltransferase [Bacilli bacterium]